MSGHHPLTLARRWLIDLAKPDRLALALLLALLAVTAALMMLEGNDGGNRSEIIEIENPAPNDG